MALDKKKKEISNRKEMVITLKSKPKPNSVESSKFKSNVDRKRRDFRKKGTRGSLWIG